MDIIRCQIIIMVHDPSTFYGLCVQVGARWERFMKCHKKCFPFSYHSRQQKSAWVRNDPLSSPFLLPLYSRLLFCSQIFIKFDLNIWMADTRHRGIDFNNQTIHLRLTFYNRKWVKVIGELNEGFNNWFGYS